MSEVVVQVPTGWTVLEDPPEGVALVALAPADDAPVRANLVVTMGDRPSATVDEFLDAVLGQLFESLDGGELVDAWTVDEPEAAPPTLGQRYVVRYRSGDATVVLVQQHTWLDDALVTVSVTAAEDAPDDLVDVLVRCLEPSVGPG